MSSASRPPHVLGGSYEAPDPRALEIVDRFAEAWARPQLDRFMELLHPEVRLLQPVTRPILGKEAARREFSRLLQWLPDLEGRVDDWGVQGGFILIAWRLGFTLGGQRTELRIVDRIVVVDGLIGEREAYYDSLQLMIELLKRPRAWWGYGRYRGYLP